MRKLVCSTIVSIVVIFTVTVSAFVLDLNGYMKGDCLQLKDGSCQDIV